MGVNTINNVEIIESKSTANATDNTGTTGTLRTAGGASIAQDLYVGGTLYAGVINTTSIIPDTITLPNQDVSAYEQSVTLYLNTALSQRKGIFWVDATTPSTKFIDLTMTTTSFGLELNMLDAFPLTIKERTNTGSAILQVLAGAGATNANFVLGNQSAARLSINTTQTTNTITTSNGKLTINVFGGNDRFVLDSENFSISDSDVYKWEFTQAASSFIVLSENAGPTDKMIFGFDNTSGKLQLYSPTQEFLLQTGGTNLVRIKAGATVGSPEWEFRNDGVLVVPDGTGGALSTRGIAHSGQVIGAALTNANQASISPIYIEIGGAYYRLLVWNVTSYASVP